MHATKHEVHQFMNASVQFIIPIYQRHYEWGRKQCERLLFDILNMGNTSTRRRHFIGNVVSVSQNTIHEGAKTIEQIQIIDGQQRITTLTLIYIALYRLCKNSNDSYLKNEAEHVYKEYLVHEDSKSTPHKLRLKVGHENEQELRDLINGEEHHESSSNMMNNFRFFQGAITERNYQTVRNGLERLDFISIELSPPTDKPQRIFESLNSTGVKLSQSDLIRNYILITPTLLEQEHIYDTYWDFIEKHAYDESKNEVLLDDFIRHYLIIQNKRIPTTTKVYEEFKQHFEKIEGQDAKMLQLQTIKSLATPYHRLVNPQNEPDPILREHFQYIRNLGKYSCYPFLMKVYQDYNKRLIDKTIFVKVLELTQMIIMRRHIADLPSTALKNIFVKLSTVAQSDAKDYMTNLEMQAVKMLGSNRIPTDEEIQNTFGHREIYRPDERVLKKEFVYMLQRMERYKNPENVDNFKSPIVVEHIFPENPSQEWQYDLEKKDYEDLENKRSTIANIVIVQKRSDKIEQTFLQKKQHYDEQFWLNRTLQGFEHWTPHALEKRYKMIEKVFFEIWKYPKVTVEYDDELNIFDADDPTGKKLAHARFMGEKINVTEILTLYRIIMRELYELSHEFFYHPECPPIHLLHQSQEKKGWIEIAQEVYIKASISHADKFKFIKRMLHLANLEDELYIKFQEQK